MGFIVCRRDEEEHFLSYGYHENKSKLLYSFYKRRIPNCFGGAMFKRHHLMFDSGELNGEFSHLYFFLPSICDCNEEISKYLGSVNIHPTDISEKKFGENFNPPKLDCNNSEKPKGTESVVNMLKKIVQLSNSNIVKNKDALLNKMSSEIEIEWLGKTKKRTLDDKFKYAF